MIQSAQILEGLKINSIKIGAVSDTHLTSQNIKENSGMFSRLKQLADKFFNRVDLIIHAGDIESFEVIRCLQHYAPVVFVPGNVDREDAIINEPEVKILDSKSVKFFPENLKIVISHERKKLFRFGTDPSVNILIFGHSHIPSIEVYDNQYWINPGSVKRPCGDIAKPSCAVIEITEKIEAKIEYFDA